MPCVINYKAEQTWTEIQKNNKMIKKYSLPKSMEVKKKNVI